MKRNLLFTFASVLTLVVGFISCTNDEFDECFPVPATTRSVTEAVDSTMTLEEAKERLRILNETYGTDFILNEETESKYDDDFFRSLENIMIRGQKIQIVKVYSESGKCSYRVIDDSLLDEVSVASLDDEMDSAITPEPEKPYKASGSSDVCIQTNHYSDFNCPFKRLEHIFSFSFGYGRNSTITFQDITNTTIHDQTNIKDGEFEVTPSDEFLQELGDAYAISYVPGSLYLETQPIRYDKNDPENLYKVNFDYCYMVQIGNWLFEVMTSYRDVSQRTVRMVNT